MGKFFKRLSLPVKLLLLILLPIALVIYLAFEIYGEKSQKASLLKVYVDRINLSADISDLINNLQAERRYSYTYALKKDIDSRAQLDIQRPFTDQSLRKLEGEEDRSIKHFPGYTFLDSLASTRMHIDSGTSPALVMHYYTTAIFRINTLNLVAGGNNSYLNPVFDDLSASKILNEMSTYLGIIRANLYNGLYMKKNDVYMLYGLLGTYDVFNSYEREFLIKASPETIRQYMVIRNQPDLRGTLSFIDKAFKTFSLDTSYDAEKWWNDSGVGTDRLRSLQKSLIRNVKTKMSSIYAAEAKSVDRTLIFLIVALVVVFGIMIYVTHIITQMLINLNRATQKIAEGGIGVDVNNVSNDVIGGLAESIRRIDDGNKILTEATDAIGKGNFNIPIGPRSKEDALVNAIIRMKENLRRFTNEIEKSKERFREVADTAPVMIWMTDKDKLCTFVNKGWLSFTGRKPEQEMGYGWIEGIYPDDYTHAAEIFEDAFRAREKYDVEYRFKRHDGEYRWLSESGTPRYSSEGEFEGYIGTCLDIHEMKVHEQRKDDFIKMASHELKTPVTSIKGYVQLLLSMYKDHDKNNGTVPAAAIQNSLNTIDKQVVKLTRLMSELLDLSRIDTGKLELNRQEFNLNMLVAETIQDLQFTTTHEITIKQDGEYAVTGDRDRIAQVLQNLLTNAIKYSPRDQKIEVNISKPEQKAVRVSITDYGIGIDEKDQQKIFERFYRVEGRSEQTYPGFGIGLFIANEIIQRHHGVIGVESKKGKGAQFFFTLPL